MGLLDLFKPERDDAVATRSALEEAREAGADDGAVARLVSKLLDVGIDGSGPLDSARQVAEEARRETGSEEEAVKTVARRHVVGGAAGGFVTGLGGFVTLPVAMPVNVFEFYVQATRMVGAIAHLRGYDLGEQQVRTAVALTLVGADADELLARAGLSTGGGRVTALALRKLPPTAMLVINKAIGFRLLRGIGTTMFSRLGRAVPLAGGVVGGAVDGWMMKRIADQAMVEFPRTGGPAAT